MKTKVDTEEPMEDYRFVAYRLNQLELKISKGLDKLEREQNENNKELMKMLRVMEESNNQINQTLIKISEKQQFLEQQVGTLDELKEKTSTNEERINYLTDRLNVYKQILFLVAGTAGSAVILALLDLILIH